MKLNALSSGMDPWGWRSKVGEQEQEQSAGECMVLACSEKPANQPVERCLETKPKGLTSHYLEKQLGR